MGLCLPPLSLALSPYSSRFRSLRVSPFFPHLSLFPSAYHSLACAPTCVHVLVYFITLFSPCKCATFLCAPLCLRSPWKRAHQRFTGSHRHRRTLVSKLSVRTRMNALLVCPWCWCATKSDLFNQRRVHIDAHKHQNTHTPPLDPSRHTLLTSFLSVPARVHQDNR